MSKQEISSLDAKKKLADKNKQEAEKTALEAEKQSAERQKTFLERRLALYDAEVDQARAGKKLGEVTQRALKFELELANHRADRAKVVGVDATATLRQDEVIRDLERETLEAFRDRADAAKDFAAKDQDIARRRLDLYQAQVAASGGASK